MADADYETECQRAELLGITPPTYNEFMKNRPQIEPTEPDEADELQEAAIGSEKIGHISGGLDELTSILQSTQKKLNRFRASCGSLSGLLRFKLGAGARGSAESLAGEPPTSAANGREGDAPGTERRSDLARALDNHVGRLDSMIDKAERAELSMTHQTREMKRAL